MRRVNVNNTQRNQCELFTINLESTTGMNNVFHDTEEERA